MVEKTIRALSLGTFALMTVTAVAMVVVMVAL